MQHDLCTVVPVLLKILHDNAEKGQQFVLGSSSTLCTFVMSWKSCSFTFSSCGCTVISHPSIPFFRLCFISRSVCLKYIRKHQWPLHRSPPSFNSHSPQTITERPPLRAFYSFLPQCLQKTHKGLYSASNKPQRRGEEEESSPCSGQCRGSELRHKQYFHDFRFQAIALGSIEDRIHNTARRE